MDRRVAFEELYRAHGAAVRAFVHRRVPRELADEVTADVFVAAWRRFDEPRPDDALAWLFAIARGTIANRRCVESRRVALHERLRATVVAGDGPGPEERVLRAGDLTAAFRALREADREVLRLVAWDGLDRDAAARVLGISPSGFSVRLHRARRRLRRELARREADVDPSPAGPPVGVGG